jgi:hypothetical protein
MMGTKQRKQHTKWTKTNNHGHSWTSCRTKEVGGQHIRACGELVHSPSRMRGSPFIGGQHHGPQLGRLRTLTATWLPAAHIDPTECVWKPCCSGNTVTTKNNDRLKYTKDVEKSRHPCYMFVVLTFDPAALLCLISRLMAPPHDTEILSGIH